MNAREEFLEEVKNKELLCASLTRGEEYRNNIKNFNLPVGYTAELYKNFLDSLNFLYDDGFGSQELHGFIWYADGTWSERSEYDGSEWWEHKEPPKIPDVLFDLVKEKNHG